MRFKQESRIYSTPKMTGELYETGLRVRVVTTDVSDDIHLPFTESL
jgi:hypothetical protein